MQAIRGLRGARERERDPGDHHAEHAPGEREPTEHVGRFALGAVEAHAGRIVKLTGDGFLAEFGTVLAAVECAVAMQDRLADRFVFLEVTGSLSE